MASESILEKLIQTAKTSPLFKGKSEGEIRAACMKHKDKDDRFIELTIQNIQKKNEAISGKAGEGQPDSLKELSETLEQGKEAAGQQLLDAEKILSKLMNL
ncbi:MAG: hypothetical protein OEY44_04750 [Candidatus Peregrinibacteria bacterium]|nr:hypothetical protein [Candidatus Peregrinibacteria bacterium]